MTKVVCIRADSKTVFEWPSVHNQAKFMADGVYLRGVMNNYENGKSYYFNWVMSNGDVSKQAGPATHGPFMMPEGAHLRIKTVDIYHSSYIRGFKFFDNHHSLLWDIGYTPSHYTVETVEL